MNRPESCDNQDVRRTVCKVCIGGLAFASAGMVAAPVATFVLARPSRIGADKPVEVPLDQLTEGQAIYQEYRGQQIIVMLTSQEYRVLSASCPHLGCNVTWDTADQVFRCPCHGAVFDAEGGIISGPVNAPLKSIAFEVKGDKLIIS